MTPQYENRGVIEFGATPTVVARKGRAEDEDDLLFSGDRLDR